MTTSSILIVEDDIISAEALRHKLMNLGYTVSLPVSSGEKALESAISSPPDLVLMDINLSETMDGIEAATAIQARIDVPVIYMTAYTDQDVLQRAKVTTPYGYIVKPIRDREMQIAIEMALYRHHMEARLKDRERWFDTLLKSIGDAVVATDEKGRVLFMNPVAEKLTGWVLSDARDLPFESVVNLIDEATGKPQEHLLSRVLNRSKIIGLSNHTIIISKDGTRRSIDDSVAPIKDHRDNLTGVVMVFRDVSQRRKMEIELENHRTHLEDLVSHRTKSLSEEIAIRKRAEKDFQREVDFRSAIIEKMAEGFCVCREIPEPPYILFTIWNHRMTEITGYTMAEINQKGWYQTVYPDPEVSNMARDRMSRMRKGENLENEEWEITRSDGQKRTLFISTSLKEGNGEDIQVLAVMRDVTELKKAQMEKERLTAQLLQAQKMEAIGNLAGGIAHDFNNILSAIIGNAEILELFKLTRESDGYSELQSILHAASRAQDLVNQILTFSRKSDVQRSPLAIEPVIKEALKLLRASMPATIEIQREIETLPGAVLANPTQIHQIIMNLCTNAAYAMRDNGGILTISLAPVNVNGQHQLALPPGNYVELKVTDTGHGIPTHLIDRIFDPYFTTKENGEGTGLGMAVVHGIVKQYGGEVTVKSEPDRGTEVSVYLPIQMHEDQESQKPSLPLFYGSGTVLVVDDEESITHIIETLLQQLGYHVKSTNRSDEALRIFNANPDGFDLLITDQTMPMMTGLDLIREVRKIRPNQSVILCTGYSETVDSESARTAGIDEFISKPIHSRDLADTVARVLKKSRTQTGKMKTN